MGWNVDGINEDWFRDLRYNEPTNTLLARFERSVGDGGPVGSLYLRRHDETEYRKVFGADEFTSVDHVVTAEAAPIAFFNVYERRKESKGGRDWAFLARLDLLTGEIARVLDHEALAVGHQGFAARAWVRELLSASRDGKSVVCILGRQRDVTGPRPTGGNGAVDHIASVTVDYSVSRIEIATRHVEVLTALRNTFF